MPGPDGAARLRQADALPAVRANGERLLRVGLPFPLSAPGTPACCAGGRGNRPPKRQAKRYFDALNSSSRRTKIARGSAACAGRSQFVCSSRG